MKTPKRKLSSNILTAAGLCLIAVLAGAYVFQVNKATTLAYAISQEERAIAKIAEENRMLIAQYATAVTFREFEKLALAHEFTTIERMSYVQLTGDTVAQYTGRE